MVCMGILVDIKAGLLQIPDKKLQQIKDLCLEWSCQTFASKRQLQSLLGKLLCIHCCVHPARLFVNSVLALLRSFLARFVSLDNQFLRDMA